MKTFREFINEETMPFAQTEKGFVGIDSPAVRDNINSLIAGVTDCEFITPYIALERVAKVLANFHIFLPKQTFLDSDRGMVTIEINQFGEKVGMQDNGEVVTQASLPYYLYFEYEVDDNGTFEVFSEVVTEDELDEILSDMDEDDEELDEEKDSENEKEEDDEDEDEEEKIDEAVGTHLDAPQKGKLASINKLNKEEKSGMPAWYEKEKSKSASLQAATKAKKKEQQKKTDYAIRNMKEEILDEKLTDHQLYMNGAISRDEYEKRTGKGRYKKPDPKERYGVVNKNLVKTVKEEQLDELSKKTLRSYVKGAEKSYGMEKGYKRQQSERIGKTPEQRKDIENQTKNSEKIMAKRSSGMELAKKKLAKEENINELSTAKLKDYKAKSFNYVRGAADGEADSKKVPNRFKGMEVAKKKLATREKEIDNNIDRQMRSKRSDRFGIDEEKIDEISKEKVSKYLDANEKSREKLASKSGLHGPNIKRTPENDAAEKKLMSRVKSRDTALAKKYPQYGNAKVAATEETLDEISKATLGSYIKAASHDVAAKSAAVRGFARDAEAQRKDKKPMDARKSDERADKMFKKSWNRRQYMAKAVDKLTKEENINELSPATMSSYVRKSSERKAQDSADMSRIQTSGNPEGAALYKKMHRDVTNRSKGISRANAKLAKEENLPEAKDSYAAYQRRMGMNPEKAAKKEGEWSKQIKKQEKKAKPKTE